jgi:uncharacterized protein YdeI (YjbR/CyaY-like superfamily)
VVEEALCFGWVDGIVRSLGPETYANRYTPRRKSSPWSRINLAKMAELERAGRLHPAGRAAFERRDPKASAGYSFEERPAELSPDLLREFRTAPRAWSYFSTQPPSYRRTSVFWVMSAKQEATRRRRLGILIRASAQRTRIDLLSPGRTVSPTPRSR